jgi:hypothetical protein
MTRSENAELAGRYEVAHLRRFATPKAQAMVMCFSDRAREDFLPVPQKSRQHRHMA